MMIMAARHPGLHELRLLPGIPNARLGLPRHNTAQINPAADPNQIPSSSVDQHTSFLARSPLNPRSHHPTLSSSSAVLALPPRQSSSSSPPLFIAARSIVVVIATSVHRCQKLCNTRIAVILLLLDQPAAVT